MMKFAAGLFRKIIDEYKHRTEHLICSIIKYFKLKKITKFNIKLYLELI